MSSNGKSSREIHASLGHKVVDSDGHWIEFMPLAMDSLKKIAGPRIAGRWQKEVSYFGQSAYAKMTQQEKSDKRHGQPPWWGLVVKNTLDVATSYLPKLLHERLPDMGMDFAVLYPSGPQLLAPYLSDDELRQAGARAFNIYAAETWKPYSDRCAPVGVIPMNTPEEAVAELEHCKSIGIKAVALGSLIRRQIPALAGKGISRRYSVYHDVLGLDSPYDYDPVWKKCLELGYGPSFHTGSQLIGLRNSPTNHVYNHIGHFGDAGHAVAKAIFMGGATRRFPQLRWAFLEGGSTWACSLFADLIGHWEKRNINAVKDYDPTKYDFPKIAEYMKRYGGDAYLDRLEEFKEALLGGPAGSLVHLFRPEELDDFAAAKIEKKQDIHDLFVPKFYFGCEADDSTTNYAFAAQANPFNAKLHAMLASDISHFDVLDMSKVLVEAREHVEDYGMSEEDFYAFTFGNAVDFWTANNADFFKGTVVEKEAAAHRGAGKRRTD